jgi:hypothetical protein
MVLAKARRDLTGEQKVMVEALSVPKPKRVLSEEQKARMAAGRKAAAERRAALVAAPASENQAGGANYGEPMYLQARLRGGGCGCGARRGGYRPTKKNRAALKKWRKGQSIGFTMTSSLKAKGLIPRTSRKNKGKKVISAKYK